MPTTHEQLANIMKIADRCVRCALCNPYCPTYAIAQNECESPRGRIAIMKALAEGTLPFTSKTATYLDHCLVCRACEKACPANVAYGELITQTRAYLTNRSSEKKSEQPLPHKRKKSLYYLTTSKWLQTLCRYLVYGYQKSGLQRLARRLKILKLLHLARYDNYVDKIIFPKRWRSYYAPQGKKQGDVGLFIGCISNMLDQELLSITIQLLTKCGYGVTIPKQQTCCGSMQHHAGNVKKAERLAKINRSAFNELSVDTIVTVASGCGGMLYEDKLLKHRVVDISHFLNAISFAEHLTLKPLKQTIALHTPCTLKNVMQQTTGVKELLKRIPGLEIVELTKSCCGAAGDTMLQYPEISKKIVQPHVQKLSEMKVNTLVTSNIGCALHFMDAFQNKAMKISHPLELFWQSLL